MKTGQYYDFCLSKKENKSDRQQFPNTHMYTHICTYVNICTPHTHTHTCKALTLNTVIHPGDPILCLLLSVAPPFPP